MSFLLAFLLGGIVGGWICYSAVKQYRKDLGLNPDPFHVSPKEHEIISRIKKWTNGRRVTKDSLREFLNKLKEEYVS